MIPKVEYVLHTIGVFRHPELLTQTGKVVSSSFPDLDSVFGIEDGSVTLLVGKRGSGKTLTASRIGAFNIKRDLSVLHVCVGAHTVRDLHHWYQGWVIGCDVDMLRSMCSHFDADFSRAIEQISRSARCRERCADVVIVDGLELLSPGGKSYASAVAKLRLEAQHGGFAVILTATPAFRDQLEMESEEHYTNPHALIDHELHLHTEDRVIQKSRYRSRTVVGKHQFITLKRAHRLDVSDEVDPVHVMIPAFPHN